MTPEEYAAFDGTGLAAAIVDGTLTRHEVHEAATAALASADRALHPFAQGPWSEPLDAAESGPFAGVPFVLKDLACHAAGVPQFLGTRALAAGITKDHDSELMARFRRAGLRTYGTVRIPELALNATTEPLLGGPTLSPWDPARSPGGSSGGSAALVAAGAVPLAHANDGGGSIRVPAAYSGVLGLKPSRGRVPIGPDIAEAFYGNVVEFAVTRTVRDAAWLLDAVHGPLPGERYAAPAPRRPFAEELHGPERRLRVAMTIDSWSDTGLHPDVVRALTDTATTLASLGHVVEVIDPFLDWEQTLDAMVVAFCAGTAADVLPLAAALGIGVDRDHFEATTVACARAGAVMTPMDLAGFFATVNTLSRRMAATMQDYDLLLSPVTATPAVPLGHFDADDDTLDARGWVHRVIAPHAACAPYNLSGAPAISIPSTPSDAGLPIGVQLGADQFREDLLLAVAAELEEAAPWAGRRPQFHVADQVVFA